MPTRSRPGSQKRSSPSTKTCSRQKPLPSPFDRNRRSPGGQFQNLFRTLTRRNRQLRFPRNGSSSWRFPRNARHRWISLHCSRNSLDRSSTANAGMIRIFQRALLRLPFGGRSRLEYPSSATSLSRKKTIIRQINAKCRSHQRKRAGLSPGSLPIFFRFAWSLTPYGGGAWR